MSFNAIMKIVGAAGLVLTSLATAGIVPGALAVVGTVIAGLAGYGHASPVTPSAQVAK